MPENLQVIFALLFLVAVLLVLVICLVLRNHRSHYVGAIHVVIDGYDSDKYMFLVIEKGKENYIQDGKIVKLKIVEDIPERGRDA